MAVVENWTENAAREIYNKILKAQFSGGDMLDITELRIKEIIEFHCPFKQEVVYEEVPETSRKLDEILDELADLHVTVKSIYREVR